MSVWGPASVPVVSVPRVSCPPKKFWEKISSGFHMELLPFPFSGSRILSMLLSHEAYEEGGNLEIRNEKLDALVGRLRRELTSVRPFPSVGDIRIRIPDHD